jgi:hypothetical protein
MASTNGNGAEPSASAAPNAATDPHELQAIINDRLAFATMLGFQFDGRRDVYKALGYPKTITFHRYYGKYRREDIAATIVEAPVEASWEPKPIITDDLNPDVTTTFDKAIDDLDKRVKLFYQLQRADALSRIGRFGLLFLGIARQMPGEQAVRVNGPEDLVYLQPLHEGHASVSEFDTDPTSPRFGCAAVYEVNIAFAENRARARQRVRDQIRVHWTRCIHLAEDPIDSRVYGRPALEVVFNKLEDLLKIGGATGEMFWRGAYQGLHANIPAEASARALRESRLDEFKQQIQDYLDGYNRLITTRAVDITSLGSQIADPRGAWEVMIDAIAAATKIPKRILLGSERGELASSQDERAWWGRVRARREQYVTPAILRPTIDQFIELGILPEPSGGNYEVSWPTLGQPVLKERAEIAAETALAMQRWAEAEALGPPVISRAEFRQHIMDLPPADDPINEMSEADQNKLKEKWLPPEPLAPQPEGGDQPQLPQAKPKPNGDART